MGKVLRKVFRKKFTKNEKRDSIGRFWKRKVWVFVFVLVWGEIFGETQREKRTER